MALGDDDDLKEEHLCCRCGRDCDPIELQICPSCHKKYCVFCVFRMGGAEYCSRPCGERLFFGEMDEEGGFNEDEA